MGRLRSTAFGFFCHLTFCNGQNQDNNFLDVISAVSNSSEIINIYTSILAVEPCLNTLIIEDAANFNTGDTVLIIQMNGAVIDITNTSGFGTVTDYKHSGNYEFNYIKSKTGNSIELKNNLIRQYDTQRGKVQLVRSPSYKSLNVASTLTCLPWDGSKGGVLVFNVQDTLELNADIDVSGKGFKGGPAKQGQYRCDIDSFYVLNKDGTNGSAKGEGIFLNSRLLNGRGKVANGGGGGNSTNSGGAGGGNGGHGGEGGKEWAGCNINFSNGGVGGSALSYNNDLNRIYLGGGGGAGQMNDVELSGGGNGGGIVIIMTNYLKSNSRRIKSEGKTPIHLTSSDDGRSGGGAGGTILVNYGSLIDVATVSVKGGNGDYCIAIPDWYHGPGGGGGGGIIWTNKTVNDPLLITTLLGGMPGTNVNIGNNAWGATQGQSGNTLFNLSIPTGNIPFVPVAISSFMAVTICQGKNYSGYSTSGTYIDTFISVNGCDSIRRLVLTVKPKSYSSIIQTICPGQTYSGYNVGGIYIDTLLTTNGCDSIRTLNLTLKPRSLSTIIKSICQGQNFEGYLASGTYIDTLVATNGCDSMRTINLTVKPRLFSTITQSICQGQNFAGYTNSGTYIDTLVAANGCDSVRTLHLAVQALSQPYLGADTILCTGEALKLYAGHFNTYNWQNGSTNDSLIVKKGGLYSVIVTDNCHSARDEIMVKEVNCDIRFPSAFTPNNDGKNDWFRMLGGHNTKEFHMIIYNRWGQKVFETFDSGEGWDGLVNGVVQSPAVFIWYCEFNILGNADKRKMKGVVTLIK